jgi:microcystin degradation protein MlrC
MRIGILAFLHESNSFIVSPTTWRNFEEDTVAIGDDILERFVGSHHELGGFLAGLDRASEGVPVEIVPILAVRATPSGTISKEAFDELLNRTLCALQRSMPLDGLLVAAHGAAVSEKYRDADGYWLTQIRAMVGAKLPVVVTLDAHANLSPAMVEASTAIIAYRTNRMLVGKNESDDGCSVPAAGHQHRETKY